MAIVVFELYIRKETDNMQFKLFLKLRTAANRLYLISSFRMKSIECLQIRGRLIDR